MADSTEDQNGVERLRELEAMVQKLKKENKRLLTKVDQPPSEDTNVIDEEFQFEPYSSEAEEDEWWGL